MTIDLLQYVEEQHPSRMLLLYHWDTDGLASAALLRRYASEHHWSTDIVCLHPTINNYFLTEAELKQIADAQYDLIVTVDLNFPLSTIEALEAIGKPVFVFDHHAQTAGIERPGIQDPAYPGCSLLMNDYLLMPLSVAAVLGAVGDQEERIVQYSAFYPQVEQIMKETAMTLTELIYMTKRIDSCYVFHDTAGMHRAIDLLATEPLRVCSEPLFLEHEAELAQELMRITAQEPTQVRAGVRVLHITSKASVISEVTRALAKRYPLDVIVTDQSYGEYGNIYVRRTQAPIDLTYIATEARARGYNAGGKSEVTGIILPAEDVHRYTQWIIESLPL